jgi:hypothetical protein
MIWDLPNSTTSTTMRNSDESTHAQAGIGFAAPRTETASRGARQKIISRTKGPNHQGSSTRGSLVAQDLITDNHAGLSDSCPRAYQLLEIHATELKNHHRRRQVWDGFDDGTNEAQQASCRPREVRAPRRRITEPWAVLQLLRCVYKRQE